MSGSISLGEVAERTAVLAVACSRGERAGRYNLDTLAHFEALAEAKANVGRRVNWTAVDAFRWKHSDRGMGGAPTPIVTILVPDYGHIV
jgi:hypothetical protein